MIHDVRESGKAGSSPDFDLLLAAALQSAAFAWAAQPHRFVRRIVQSVTVEADILTTTTVYDIDVLALRATVRELMGSGVVADTEESVITQAITESSLVAPLVILPRSGGSDIIEVTRNAGRLPVLTAREGVPTMTAWLRAVLDRTTAVLDRIDLPPHNRAEIDDALGRAAQVPHAPAAAGLAVVAKAVSDVFLQVDSKRPEDLAVRESCSPFFAWARFFAEHFYLSVPLPLDADRATVSTRAISHYRDEFPDGDTASRIEKVAAATRHLLGRRTPSLRFPLPRSVSTDSFHLTMVVPASLHVHSLRVEWTQLREEPGEDGGPSVTRARFADFDLDDEHLSLSGRDSSVAHVHIKDLRSHPDITTAAQRPAVRAVVDLAEDLPGSTMPALVPALLLAALSTIFAVHLTRLFGSPPSSARSELSTAVPVLSCHCPRWRQSGFGVPTPAS